VHWFPEHTPSLSFVTFVVCLWFHDSGHTTSSHRSTTGPDLSALTRHRGLAAQLSIRRVYYFPEHTSFNPLSFLVSGAHSVQPTRPDLSALTSRPLRHQFSAPCHKKLHVATPRPLPSAVFTFLRKFLISTKLSAL
jgi:hypothetical protein